MFQHALFIRKLCHLVGKCGKYQTIPSHLLCKMKGGCLHDQIFEGVFKYHHAKVTTQREVPSLGTERHKPSKDKFNLLI